MILDDGSLSCSAPRLWNALPQTASDAVFLNAFKKNLKAYIFN